MFETLEVGKKVRKSDFNELQLPLRQQLLEAQFDLAERDYPVIIVVAGLDGAGKGSLVHRLNEWMDPRGIRTNTYWEPSDEEEERPFFYRFWRRLPPRGQIGIFLGSWYTRPAQDAVNKSIDSEEFAVACQQIESFERMLSDDGALIIKLWLHVSEEVQRMQLEGKAPDTQQNPRVTDRPYELRGKYDETLEVSERLILATDSRYDLQARQESPDYEVVVYREGLVKELPIILKGLQAKRLGFESNRVSWAQHRKISTAFQDAGLSIELVETEDIVENLRIVKTQHEISAIRQALHLAESVFGGLVAGLKPGMTEKRAAWELEKALQ